MSQDGPWDCRHIRAWHVHPLNDKREHYTDGRHCSCFPEIFVDGDGDVVVIHNSFDGREWSGEEWNARLN